MRGAPTMKGLGKALMEIVCQGRAIDQKVSDDGKDSFIKKCVKDAVGR